MQEIEYFGYKIRREERTTRGEHTLKVWAAYLGDELIIWDLNLERVKATCDWDARYRD